MSFKGVSRPVPSPTLVLTADAGSDYRHAQLSGASRSALLSELVAGAAQALDYVHEAAGALLRRAAILLHAGAARSGLTARARVRAALAPWQGKRVATHFDANSDMLQPLSECATARLQKHCHFSRAFMEGFGRTPHAGDARP